MPLRSTDPKRSRRRKVPVRGLAIAFGLAVIISGLLIYIALSELSASWRGLNPDPTEIQGALDQTLPTLAPGITPTFMTSGGTAEPLAEGERINILLMGLDRRAWQDSSSASRSDAIILVTVDPTTHTAGLISIPRDLWLPIPGFGHNRINTAYFLGEAYRVPGGGGALAMLTVGTLFDIQVHYFVALEFGAFERMIDEIGGVDVVVDQRVLLSFPGTRRQKWLEPGENHLTGEEALSYARNRDTRGSDFDREQRQQHILLGVFDRVTSLNMIPTLMTRAPALYDELSVGVRTNMSFDQMFNLALTLAQIPKANVKRGVIGPPEMAYPTTLASGAQVVIPVQGNIELLRDEIFSPLEAIGEEVTLFDLEAAAREENAIVAVLNGAGVEGIATITSEYLVEKGLMVGMVGNADRLDYVKTVVIDHTGNPYTTQYLMELMDLTQSQILAQTMLEGDIDVTVIVGKDWQIP
ncbi:MAG: LCP family protein [Anaerolineales bacterium]|jgi:LCP family protein required for cell wall assembly